MRLILISLAVDAAVREKLEKIMSLEYYTAQPDIRAAEAVAAAVEKYGAGGAQAQESRVVSPQAPETAEESPAVEEHKVKSYFLYFLNQLFTSFWCGLMIYTVYNAIIADSLIAVLYVDYNLLVLSRHALEY
jgi:hypothetical protein